MRRRPAICLPAGPFTARQSTSSCRGVWLIDYNTSTGLGSEDALTSTTVPALPGYIGSPYFGTDILTIYNQPENL